MGAFQDWKAGLTAGEVSLYDAAVARIRDAMLGYPGTLSYEQIGLTAEELRVWKSKPEAKRIPGGEMVNPVIPPTTVKALLPGARYPLAELGNVYRAGEYHVWDKAGGRIVGTFLNRADAVFFLLAVRGDLAKAAADLVREYADKIAEQCERHGTYYRPEDGERCEQCAEDAAQDAELRHDIGGSD